MKIFTLFLFTVLLSLNFSCESRVSPHHAVSEARIHELLLPVYCDKKPEAKKALQTALFQFLAQNRSNIITSDSIDGLNTLSGLDKVYRNGRFNDQEIINLGTISQVDSVHCIILSSVSNYHPQKVFLKYRKVFLKNPSLSKTIHINIDLSKESERKLFAHYYNEENDEDLGDASEYLALSPQAFYDYVAYRCVQEMKKIHF